MADTGYNIQQNDPMIVTDFTTWVSKYIENALEYSHDQSAMTLMTPDEALILVGPPRLTSLATFGSGVAESSFFIIGFAGNLNYQETSNVQPMKAIGSRRHIFAKSNAPVNGSMSRLMVLGRNLLKTLYQAIDKTAAQKNSAYGANVNDAWYTNLEDDIFRIPFGMGVVYASPGTLQAGLVYSGEYFEACMLTGKQASLQTGQSVIMENVSFVADRVVPWFSNPAIKDDDATAHTNPYAKFIPTAKAAE